MTQHLVAVGYMIAAALVPRYLVDAAGRRFTLPRWLCRLAALVTSGVLMAIYLGWNAAWGGITSWWGAAVLVVLVASALWPERSRTR